MKLSFPVTALAAALAILLGVTGLLLPRQEAQASSSPIAITVQNAGVENGMRGFTMQPAEVRMTHSTLFRGGSRSLRARTTEPTTVTINTRSAQVELPKTSSATTTTWVRSAYAGQRVSLVLSEMGDGGVVQRRWTTITPTAGRWSPITTNLTTRQEGSVLKVAVRAPSGEEKVDLFVDDFALTWAPTPTTEPTPDPDPDGELLNSACDYSARGLPSCGAYLGATYNSNTDPAKLESQLGRRLGVRRTFWTGDKVDQAVATARRDIADGRLPWISFKLPYSWEAMASGTGDAWARNLATKLAAVPGPVWVAFHHEPEGDGDIQAWRRMQERLAPLVRGLAPNVAYTVVLTGWNQFFGASQFSLANIWPRNVKIDVAGFDLYNEFGVVKNGRKNTTWPDFDRDFFAPIQAWADKQGVAWGMAETAFTDEAHARTPTWIGTTYDQMVARGGVAMAYFDTPLNAYGSWALGTSSKRAGLADPLSDSAALPVP